MNTLNILNIYIISCVTLCKKEQIIIQSESKYWLKRWFMFRLSMTNILTPRWSNHQLLSCKHWNYNQTEEPRASDSRDVTATTLEAFISLSLLHTHILVFLSLWGPSSTTHSTVRRSSWDHVHRRTCSVDFCLTLVSLHRNAVSNLWKLLRKDSSVECFWKASSLLVCVNERKVPECVCQTHDTN